MIVVYGDNKKGLLTEIIPGIAEPRPAEPGEPAALSEPTETEQEQGTEQHRPGRKRKDV